MVFGKLFSPGADKTQKKASLENQARTELDDLESKNPKRRLSSNKSEDGRKKSRYTSTKIIKRNIMMKLKAYIATMMKTRYQRKNSVQNSGGHQSGQEQ